MNRSHYSLYHQRYPDPFLDQASTKLPKSQKKLFEMLHIFATTHPQIRPIVHKLAKYVITHLVINDPEGNESTEKKWKGVLEDDLVVHEIAEGAGLDYIGYGNCFIVIHRPFVRTYMCKSCDEHVPGAKLEYYITGGKVTGACPSCKKNSIFEPKDNFIRSTKEISIVRIPPREMHIKINRLTNKSEYFRSVPPELKKAIKGTKPDRFIINTTPWKYVEAAIKNKKIRYNSKKILHLKEPTLSHHNSHWGQPIIMAALKDAYLNQIYKKADETVANERTVPARFVYPNMTSQDPFKTIGLAKWTGYMDRMIRRRRHDPNAVMPVPFPVGVAEIGGDAQRLTTANLRELVINEIIGSTGVPKGFLSDGMTYSGGTVQARMLENMISGYVRAQDRLLRFIAKEVAQISELPPVDIKWKPFKKSDDIQMLQILMQLVQMNAVSMKEVLDRMDLNFDEQHRIIMDEKDKITDIQVKEQLVSTRAALEAVKMQIMTNERQGSNQDLIDNINQESERVLGMAGDQEPPPEEPPSPEQRMQQAQADVAESEAEAQVEPLVENIVTRLVTQPPEKQEEVLAQMEERAPGVAQRVRARLTEEIGEGTLAHIRNASKNPKELADRIMMLPPGQRASAFQDLMKNDPQMAIMVSKQMTSIQTGKRKLESEAGDNTPQQKPSRSDS